jgi:hypothetical protein
MTTVVLVLLTIARKNLKDLGMRRERPIIEKNKEGSELVKLSICHNFKLVLEVMRHYY